MKVDFSAPSQIQHLLEKEYWRTIDAHKNSNFTSALAVEISELCRKSYKIVLDPIVMSASVSFISSIENVIVVSTFEWIITKSSIFKHIHMYTLRTDTHWN